MATIGAHPGNWVFVGRYENPKLRVTGHEDGKRLRVYVANAPRDDAVFEELEISQNGVHDLGDRFAFVRVDSRESIQTLICQVLG